MAAVVDDADVTARVRDYLSRLLPAGFYSPFFSCVDISLVEAIGSTALGINNYILGGPFLDLAESSSPAPSTDFTSSLPQGSFDEGNTGVVLTFSQFIDHDRVRTKRVGVTVTRCWVWNFLSDVIGITCVRLNDLLLLLDFDIQVYILAIFSFSGFHPFSSITSYSPRKGVWAIGTMLSYGGSTPTGESSNTPRIFGSALRLFSLHLNPDGLLAIRKYASSRKLLPMGGMMNMLTFAELFKKVFVVVFLTG